MEVDNVQNTVNLQGFEDTDCYDEDCASERSDRNAITASSSSSACLVPLMSNSRVGFYRDPFGGTGLLAVTDIKAGESLLTDTPLVVCSTDLTDMLQRLLLLTPDQLEALQGVPTHEDDLSEQEEAEIATVVRQANRTDILPMFRWFVSLMKCNAHGLCHKQTSWGFYPTGARANHSCQPNLSYRNMKGELAYVALRDIRRGEPLHMAYVSTLYASRMFRQTNLFRQKMFICRCERCFRDSMAIDMCRLIECPMCPRRSLNAEETTSTSNDRRSTGQAVPRHGSLRTDSTAQNSDGSGYHDNQSLGREQLGDLFSYSSCDQYLGTISEEQSAVEDDEADDIDQEEEVEEGREQLPVADIDNLQAENIEQPSAGSGADLGYSEQWVTHGVDLTRDNQAHSVLESHAILRQVDGSSSRWICPNCHHVIDESEPPLVAEVLLQTSYAQLELAFMQPPTDIWFQKLTYLKSMVEFTLGRFHWLNAGCDFLLSKFFVFSWYEHQTNFARQKAFENAFNFFDFVEVYAPAAVTIDVVPWSTALLRLALATGGIAVFLKLADKYIEPLQILYGKADTQVLLFRTAYDYLETFNLPSLLQSSSMVLDVDDDTRLLVQVTTRSLVQVMNIKLHLQQLVAASVPVESDDNVPINTYEQTIPVGQESEQLTVSRSDSEPVEDNDRGCEQEVETNKVEEKVINRISHGEKPHVSDQAQCPKSPDQSLELADVMLAPQPPHQDVPVTQEVEISETPRTCCRVHASAVECNVPESPRVQSPAKLDGHPANAADSISNPSLKRPSIGSRRKCRRQVMLSSHKSSDHATSLAPSLKRRICGGRSFKDGDHHVPSARLNQALLSPLAGRRAGSSRSRLGTSQTFAFLPVAALCRPTQAEVGTQTSSRSGLRSKVIPSTVVVTCNVPVKEEGKALPKKKSRRTSKRQDTHHIKVCPVSGILSLGTSISSLKTATLAVAITPALGTSITPALGTSITPALGTSINPALGTSITPALGTSITPDSETSACTNQTCRTPQAEMPMNSVTDVLSPRKTADPKIIKKKKKNRKKSPASTTNMVKTHTQTTTSTTSTPAPRHPPPVPLLLLPQTATQEISSRFSSSGVSIGTSFPDSFLNPHMSTAGSYVPTPARDTTAACHVATPSADASVQMSACSGQTSASSSSMYYVPRNGVIRLLSTLTTSAVCKSSSRRESNIRLVPNPGNSLSEPQPVQNNNLIVTTNSRHTSNYSPLVLVSSAISGKKSPAYPESAGNCFGTGIVRGPIATTPTTFGAVMPPPWAIRYCALQRACSVSTAPISRSPVGGYGTCLPSHSTLISSLLCRPTVTTSPTSNVITHHNNIRTSGPERQQTLRRSIV